MLNNLKIGTRLSCGFGVLLALMVLVGGYGVKEIDELKDDINLLVNNRMVKVEQANHYIDNVNIIARSSRNLLLIDNDKSLAAMEFQRIAEALTMNKGIIEELDKTVKQGQGRILLNKALTEVRPVFLRHLETLLDMIKKDRQQEAKTLLMGDFRQIQGEYFKALNEFNEYESEMAQQAGQEAERGAAAATRVTFPCAWSQPWVSAC